MPDDNPLRDVPVDEPKDRYSARHRIVKALPRHGSKVINAEALGA